jgi:hypothetical protein
MLLLAANEYLHALAVILKDVLHSLCHCAPTCLPKHADQTCTQLCAHSVGVAVVVSAAGDATTMPATQQVQFDSAHHWYNQATHQPNTLSSLN